MIINSFWKKIATTILIATLTFSCEENANKNIEQTKANTTVKPNSKQNINYGNLIIKEQSDYLMIPVTAKEPNSNHNINYSLSRTYERNDRIYNLIFYQKQNGETHLLFKKKVIIDSFDFLETKVVGKTPTRLWLYKILEQDTNADKKLNSEDAIVGYISDLSGKKLVQVTPNNTKILNWVIIPSQNALFLKIIKDADNDKKFTENDQTNFMRVNLEQPAMGTEIISDSIEQEIKTLIFK